MLVYTIDGLKLKIIYQITVQCGLKDKGCFMKTKSIISRECTDIQTKMHPPYIVWMPKLVIIILHMSE